MLRLSEASHSMPSIMASADSLTDSELAAEVARLWPHRECEANIMLGQFCRVGLPGKDIYFCFWCKKVKIDGVVHDL
jgi:hypothetical protein